LRRSAQRKAEDTEKEREILPFAKLTMAAASSAVTLDCL
jgi:hypothetical protein